MADNVIVRVPEQQFIRGEDGYSPEVTIENIDHGHSVNITDREHPEGQTFNVMDGDSAYEQAVAGGYTGTEAQFNEELASFKELSDEMKEVAPFYAEYGVTTKAEIEAAINNKRQIYLNRGGGLGGVVAPYTGTFLYADIWGEGTGYRFARTNGNWQYVYELKSEWTYSIYDLTAPADRAEEAAAQALNRMNSADASAQAAAGSAGDASTAATTATTKAGEASDSATAADGSAKDAEAYAVGKRGGTDVGSTDPAYHNNAKYYAEQASGSATAASGSATSAASSATAAGNAQAAAETAQGAAEDAQEAAEAVLASIPSDYTELSGDVDDLKSALNTKAPLIINSASGAIASFDDGADGMPLKALTVDIEPVQAGSGVPSPENVRPITGWTGCNIYHSGEDMSNPTTYPITFPSPDPGTVYGGTLDVVNKKLTVDRTIATLNGSENWQMHSTYQYAFYLDNAIPGLTVATSPTNTRFACNRYKIGTYINNSSILPSRDDGSVFNQTSQTAYYRRIWVKDTGFEGNLAGFKASLAENNLQIVYPITSPSVYDITVEQITTLLGKNNIWADCGNISAEYCADTELFVLNANERIYSDVYGNLCGAEPDVYYPVEFNSGDYLTLSTADGTTPNYIELLFYDENYDKIGAYSFNEPSRTIKLTGNYANAKYIKFSKTPNVPIMVGYGETPTEYVEYRSNIFSVDVLKENEKHVRTYGVLPIVCVMCYNVGEWYNGTRTQMPVEERDKYKNLQTEILRKNYASIFCAQEYLNEMYTGAQDAKNMFLYPLYEHVYTLRDTEKTYGKALATNLWVESVETVPFVTQEGVGSEYQKAYVYINGRKVCICNIHLSQFSYEYDLLQAQEVIDAVADEDYFIVFGDFNTWFDRNTDGNTGPEIISRFAAIGGVPCNCGSFGVFNTYRANAAGTTRNAPIDNIFVSSNITIKSVYVDETKIDAGIPVPDHVPLVAYLEIF